MRGHQNPSAARMPSRVVAGDLNQPDERKHIREQPWIQQIFRCKVLCDCVNLGLLYDCVEARQHLNERRYA